MARFRWLAIVVLLAALGALGVARAQAPTVVFTDFTASANDTATGTLTGDRFAASVEITGPDVSTVGEGSVLDGTSGAFNDPVFTPPLAATDAIQIIAPTNTTSNFSITFGQPITDPILHIGSLASVFEFPENTVITRVSGEDDFVLNGYRIEGAVEGGGPLTDANGTVRFPGTFESLDFTARPVYAGNQGDGILLQVGAEPGPAGSDVRLTKTASADTVNIGETFTYTFAVENLGPDGADNVVVNDPVPEEIDILQAPDGCSAIEGSLTCTTHELGNGGSQSFVVEATATAPGTITNTASSGPEPNDTDSATITAVDASGPHTLLVSRNGDGYGTVTSSPAGINCGQDCTEDYAGGTVVELTAQPAPGSSFLSFGGDCSGSGPTCTTTLTQDRTVTAVFGRLPEPSDARVLGRWPLDSITPMFGITPDVSGGGLHGQFAQATIVDGRFGGAFAHDGNADGWTVPDAPATRPGGPFSLLTWVRTTDPPRVGDGPLPGKPQANEWLLAKNYIAPGSCNQPSWLLTTGENGSLQFSVMTTTIDLLRQRTVTEPVFADDIWDGNWHAVSAVYQAARITLWIDGKPVSRVPIDDNGGVGIAYSGGDGPMTAGRVADDPACAEAPRRDYGELMDEVRIYNAALTRREIEYLHRPSAVTAPHLSEDMGPANLALPTITGIPKVGNTLSCQPGEWNVTGDGEFTYLWERAPRATTDPDDPGWNAIDGAIGETYTLTEEDNSSRVRCRVIATDSAGSTAAYSLSLRVDADVPVLKTRPSVVGTPTSGSVLTCDPGEWSGGPDFTFQWLRDNVAIPGATQQTYLAVRSRLGERITNPKGDGNHFLTCEVFGRNDVGLSLPAYGANRFIVDNTPFAFVLPRVTSTATGPADNPLNQGLRCSNGTWYDDDSALGNYPYEYSWFRNGEKIAGAVEQNYQPTVEDLGRRVSCAVRAYNVIGGRTFDSANNIFIELPKGRATVQIYKVGGNNPADPINLLPVTQEYKAGVEALAIKRLTSSLNLFRDKCSTQLDDLNIIEQDGPYVVADGEKIEMTLRTRCLIALRNPESQVKVTATGVRFAPGQFKSGAPYICTLEPNAFLQIQECPSMGIQLAPSDPLRPPTNDADFLRQLAPVTPQRILWDIDGNGTTDANCPGSAPVLRTIYNGGKWNPQAVIISGDEAKTGQFSFGEIPFDSAGSTGEKGFLRSGQVRVCATAFDPPPNPQTVPCVTDGQLGKVLIKGHLCPIDARDINNADFGGLDSDLRQALVQFSEARVGNEGAQTQSLRSLDPGYTGPVYPEIREPAGPQWRAAARQADSDIGNLSGTLENTMASLSGVDDGAGVKSYGQATLKVLEEKTKVDPKNAKFVYNQVYTTVGKSLRVNGVAIDPSDGIATLVAPSDIKKGLASVKSMELVSRDAKTFLGSVKQGLPMSAAPEPFKAELMDEGAKQGKALLKEANLDAVVSQLKEAADKLKLGPFKLRGDAKITINPDNTATLKAFAVLPGLSLGPADTTEARADVTLKGDTSGRVYLEGLRLKPPGLAYLGGVGLKGVDITYGVEGLDVKGEVVFPLPVKGSVVINQFKLGPDGEFQVLDVDYKAGPGGGINTGSGVYITKLGGKLNLLTDIVGANTTLSIGPAAGGNGCPTVGINAEFSVHFAEQYSVDAKGDVQVVCISLVQLHFHADQTGLVSFEGRVDKALGPIFFEGGLGAKMRMPDWQVTYDAGGGVRTPIGDVEIGFELALSNIGLAGCAKLDALVVELAGGAAIRFIDGRPPLLPNEIISNLRFFLGCDISEYRPLGRRRSASISQAGGYGFTIPQGTRGSVLSIEGAGAAPRVRLRAPGGEVLDFTDATAKGGKRVGPGLGVVIEEEDRTVVFLGKSKAGNWTAEVADGSAPIVAVERADILPKPNVKARVTGRGTQRVLHYDIKRIPGQEVRLLENANGALEILKTVKGGGKGKVRFTVSEAKGVKRQIHAQVIQDELPRTEMTLARFTAGNPKVGKAKRVRVRRKGSTAVITWAKAAYSGAYEVEVATGTGRRYVERPEKRRVVVPGVGQNEGVVANVTAFSPAGTRGKPVTATLKGNMRVGATKPNKQRPLRHRGGRGKRDRDKARRRNNGRRSAA